jgi:hypothetical protein
VRLLLADHTGDQPRDGLDHHQGRDLSPGQHVVTDRHLLGGQTLDDALVHPFVATADQGQVLLPRELPYE